MEAILSFSPEIAVVYGMSVEEMNRAKKNAFEIVYEKAETKPRVIDLLCEAYGISREAAMCAMSCGHLM